MSGRGYCLACRAEVRVGPGGERACTRCGAPTCLRGRWQVVEALAQGGSARVFRGIDREGEGEGEREVALKVLELGEIEDWKQVELFERQLPLLRTLHHPGIPEVYDAFEIAVGGRTLLVLAQSLHRGPNLRDALAAGLRFDEPSARVFLDRMLDILAYLHGFSPPILHRDIKPANILLELPDGAGPAHVRELAGRLAQVQPVLIDFDTARGAAIDARTADGTMVGSAGYVPLEQLAGRPVPASDLYALGVTMIAALSQRDVLELPVERSRLQFRGFVNVSPELQDALAGMIEPIVEDRFADVAAVRRALAGSSAARAATPSSVAKLGATQPTRRPEPAGTRAPIKLALVLGGVALLAGVAAVALRSGEPSGAAVRPAPPPEQPREPPSTKVTSEKPITEDPSRWGPPLEQVCGPTGATICDAVLRGQETRSFGRSIALSADTLVVGDSSRAWIHAREGSEWIEREILVDSKPEDSEIHDRYGSPVALDGDTLAVNVSSAANGAVYVYARADGRWVEQARLTGGRFFGQLIALDSDTLIASETHNKIWTEIVVFARAGAEWNEQARLRGFRWATGLALDGDTIVVSARGGIEDGDGTAVFVYVRDSGGWSEQARLTSTLSYGFGSSVALHGDVLAVANMSPELQTGSHAPDEVHVFTRAGASWTLQAVLGDGQPQGDVPGFGRGLALADGRLAVLVDEERQTDGRGTAIHLFGLVDGGWRLERVIPVTNMGDARVALDRETLVVRVEQGSVADEVYGTVFVLRP